MNKFNIFTIKKMFTVLFNVIVLVRSQFVSVEISSGSVVVGQKHKGYNTFFGVPYAHVDVNNPFGQALIEPDFVEPFLANDSTIMCPQVHDKVGGILQCLRLNIYVPQTTKKKFAILAWFSSSFKHGRAGDFGGEHLVKENIILVIINYRLGMYGFSCLDEPWIPANMALRDQNMALEWIQTYIDKFGGDPAAVTIGGQGYAGGLVDLHMYSAVPTHFDKAIIQSGSLFETGFFGPSNPTAASQLAKYFGQTVSKSTKPKDVLPFLSLIDPMLIVNATENLNMKLTICKEKHHLVGMKNFITANPQNLDKLGKIKETKILVGYNSMELLDAFSHNNNTKEFYQRVGNVFYNRLNEVFHLPEKEKQELSKRVQEFYIGAKEIGPETKLKVVESAADFYVNHPIERSVDRFIKAGATVYKYLFSYTGGSRYKKVRGSGASNKEELKYLFEMETKIKGAQQKKMRRTLVNYWANFIKFGNPTPKGKPTWVPVTGDSRQYLDINVKHTMKDHVFRERMAFLDLLFHTYKNHLIT